MCRRVLDGTSVQLEHAGITERSLCRYECPAGCLDSPAKVIGTVYYEMVIAYFYYCAY